MNINIVFVNKLQPDIAKATVAERICQVASLFIDLPDNLVIEFCKLDHYGESVVKFQKIKINAELSVKELIYPLVHELIHIQQIHKGLLSVTRYGDYVWKGKTYQIDFEKLSYQEYRLLPWEVDANYNQKQLLVKILK